MCVREPGWDPPLMVFSQHNGVVPEKVCYTSPVCPVDLCLMQAQFDAVALSHHVTAEVSPYFSLS